MLRKSEAYTRALHTGMIEEVMPGLRDVIMKAAENIAKSQWEDTDVYDIDEVAREIIAETIGFLWTTSVKQPFDMDGIVHPLQMSEPYYRAWFPAAK